MGTFILRLLLLGLIVGLVWWWSERRKRRTSAPPAGGLHEEILLPHSQEWELWNNSFSLCSKKLRVCMEELGLPYQDHPIDLIETGSYENISRRFLAVNPAGTVPVLVHLGHPVYESHDQIVYAARHAGEKGAALLPEEPALREEVELWTDKASLVGDPLAGTAARAGNCVPGLTLPIFATMLQYIPFTRFLEGFLFHPDKRRPLALAALKWKNATGLPSLKPALAILRRSRRDMQRHLDTLEAQLAKHGGPWIAGSRFTLADVSWVVILDRLVEADWGEHFWGGGRRPEVAAYWQRLQERPSFSRAIAQKRCPEMLNGAADLARAKREDPALRAALETEAAA